MYEGKYIAVDITTNLDLVYTIIFFFQPEGMGIFLISPGKRIVGTHLKRLNEALLMCTHSIHFFLGNKKNCLWLLPLICKYFNLLWRRIFSFIAPKGEKKSPNKSPKKKGGKKRNPWSDSEGSADNVSDLSDNDMDGSFLETVAIPRERGPRRQAGNNH